MIVRRRSVPVRLLSVLALLAACATPPGAGAADGLVSIPVRTAEGQVVPIQARLCRPSTPGPARLVVINHGSPANPADRPNTRPARCDSEAVAWFLGRGDAVLQPIRRGYGATGGLSAEDTGPCARVDYRTAGLETARDIAAAVEWGTAQPGIRPDGVIVVGQSAGGWGAIALDSLPHPKVAAFVNMAGGRGGHLNMVPNRNCSPNLLAAAAGAFGTTAGTPMLWVYTANDSFFARPIAEAMATAFTQAGGRITFEQPGPFGRDGHGLFFGAGGTRVWGPLVDRYLAAQLGHET